MNKTIEEVIKDFGWKAIVSDRAKSGTLLQDYEEEAKREIESIIEARIMGLTIAGKSIEEAAAIINGLELERITGIAVTMDNLSALYKRLMEEVSAINHKMIEQSFRSVHKGDDE